MGLIGLTVIALVSDCLAIKADLLLLSDGKSVPFQ